MSMNVQIMPTPVGTANVTENEFATICEEFLPNTFDFLGLVCANAFVEASLQDMVYRLYQALIYGTLI